MSVLIRGMDKIPEDGAVLMVKHEDNGKVYIKYAGMMGYSMELEKIPKKHGRLVDIDKLLVILNDPDCNMLCGDVARECTIIEAEGWGNAKS